MQFYAYHKEARLEAKKRYMEVLLAGRRRQLEANQKAMSHQQDASSDQDENTHGRLQTYSATDAEAENGYPTRTSPRRVAASLILKLSNKKDKAVFVLDHDKAKNHQTVCDQRSSHLSFRSRYPYTQKQQSTRVNLSPTLPCQTRLQTILTTTSRSSPATCYHPLELQDNIHRLILEVKRAYGDPRKSSRTFPLSSAGSRKQEAGNPDPAIAVSLLPSSLHQTHPPQSASSAPTWTAKPNENFSRRNLQSPNTHLDPGRLGPLERQRLFD